MQLVVYAPPDGVRRSGPRPGCRVAALGAAAEGEADSAEHCGVTTRILVGDCLEVLRTLPAESVHMCVTSPPYYQLRDYQTSGQIGLEASPVAFVQKLVDVFREVWRVLRPDATCWINIGDSYAGSGKGPSNSIQGEAAQIGPSAQKKRGLNNLQDTPTRWVSTVGKPKDLLLIPFRLALGLQEDGWYVRSDIAWCKRSCMPESVQDRPTSAWEHVFLLSKQARYYYDADAVREESVSDHASGNGYARPERLSLGGRGQEAPWEVQPMRNQRNFWLLGPEPFSEAHFAVFPSEIPRRAILAGCPEGGTVLDPFFGAGTTGLVADRLRRDCIGIEINPDYAEIARRRIDNESPMFAEVSVA